MILSISFILMKSTFVIASFYTNSTYLCDKVKRDNYYYSGTLCLVGYNKSDFRIRINNVKIVRIKDFSAVLDYSSCDVAIIFKTKRSLPILECPGKCYPTPIAYFVEHTLENITGYDNLYFISCSSSIKIYDKTRTWEAKKYNNVSNFFEAIYFRRLMECREKIHWPLNMPQIYTQRQPIKGVFIWVGTNQDIKTLRYQRSVLPERQNFAKTVAVSDDIRIWLATEDIYSCSNETILCKEANSFHFHKKFMPLTGTLVH